MYEYANGYLATNDNAAKDEKALAAGRRIRNGEVTKKNYLIIFDWKLEAFIRRKLPHIMTARDSVAEEDIQEVLSIALRAQRDRTIIAVLMALPAVKLRVASAIAAMIWPERYTVMDVRALGGLGAPNTAGNIDTYLEYVAACKELAKRYGVDLRTLDRALFHWSELQSKARKRTRYI